MNKPQVADDYPMLPIANGERHASTGRFLPGNTASKGRKFPHAAHAMAIRQAFMETVQPEDVAEIVGTLLRQAKAGDVYSAKLILDRVAPQKDFEAAANSPEPEDRQKIDMSSLTDEQLEVLASIGNHDAAKEEQARKEQLARLSLEEKRTMLGLYRKMNGR